MKKANRYTKLGLLFNGLFLICNRVDFIPHFFKGFFVGLGITLILVGLTYEKWGLSKIKQLKRKVICNILRR